MSTFPKKRFRKYERKFIQKTIRKNGHTPLLGTIFPGVDQSKEPVCQLAASSNDKLLVEAKSDCKSGIGILNGICRTSSSEEKIQNHRKI